jgi:DNA topoisomerase-1
MVIKWGRNGKFLACSKFPECKNTHEFTKDANGEIMIQEKKQTNIKCEKCDGMLVIKRGKFGEFLACSNYPECKFTKPITTGVKCPMDGCTGELVQKTTRKKKIFYSCNRYPDCTYALWNKPVSEPCPLCSHPFLIEKFIKNTAQLTCPNKGCKYVKE